MQLLDRFIAPHRSAQIVRQRILVINGHPDPRPERYCAALCRAYEDGARAAGLTVRQLAVGKAVPAPGSAAAPADLLAALEDMGWATRLMVVFPLWMDLPPKALCELFEVFQQLNLAARKRAPDMRQVVTMEMPAFFHRVAGISSFQAPKSPAAMDLPGFPGADRIFIGSVDSISPQERGWWLKAMREAGTGAARPRAASRDRH